MKDFSKTTFVISTSLVIKYASGSRGGGGGGGGWVVGGVGGGSQLWVLERERRGDRNMHLFAFLSASSSTFSLSSG